MKPLPHAGTALLVAVLVFAAVAVPTLLIVGERDPCVHAVNEALLQQLAGPRRLELVPEAGALLDEPAALAHAAASAAAWFGRHLA